MVRIIRREIGSLRSVVHDLLTLAPQAVTRSTGCKGPRGFYISLEPARSTWLASDLQQATTWSELSPHD